MPEALEEAAEPVLGEVVATDQGEEADPGPGAVQESAQVEWVRAWADEDRAEACRQTSNRRLSFC